MLSDKAFGGSGFFCFFDQDFIDESAVDFAAST